MILRHNTFDYFGVPRSAYGEPLQYIRYIHLTPELRAAIHARDLAENGYKREGAAYKRAKYLLYCASEGGMRQTEILFTRTRNHKKLFDVDGALPEILDGNSMDNHHEWVTVTPKVSLYKDDGDAVHNTNLFEFIEKLKREFSEKAPAGGKGEAKPNDK
jgi:hypothetical protein